LWSVRNPEARIGLPSRQLHDDTESLEDELVGTAWESHVDKRPRSDTLNVEDDRRKAREAEVSRVR